MKPAHFYISTTLAVLCLLLAIVLVIIASANRGIERGLAEQQMVINRGQVSQQIGSALVRDLAGSSVSNTRIKELLSKHGINVSVNNSPSN